MILDDRYEDETAKDYAYRVIKENIISLGFKPGELLSEGDLANKLSISRTPIREALIKLKGKRLIEVRPQIGTYVSLIDWKLVEEAIFVRNNLEKAALQEACRYFQEDKLIQMEECLKRQREIADSMEHVLEFHKLDKTFHKLLFQGIDKPTVWDMIFSISGHYSRMRLLAEMNLNKDYIVEEHEKYLEIIREKKMQDIEQAVKSHIEDQVKVWEDLIESSEYVAKYIKNK